MKTTMKFHFENGLTLEVDEVGFSVSNEDGDEILAGVDFDCEFGYIQIPDTTRFKVFKDKEISTFQIKRD